MSKPAAFPFNLPEGFPELTSTARESFETMTRAYSEWLRNANRVQAEMIRFVGERFTKDVSMMSRFADCKKPEDYFKVQGELLTELTADYQQEGARILGLFGDAAQQAMSGFTRTGAAKR
jgi:hypothetical protein